MPTRSKHLFLLSFLLDPLDPLKPVRPKPSLRSLQSPLLHKTHDALLHPWRDLGVELEEIALAVGNAHAIAKLFLDRFCRWGSDEEDAC